ncbi:hypothetical protein I4F81_003491 [Pyropia yezoensis]|uniref:Uncharacterized protein n=1 Tax=Pyropia yezoensis TaxID=2788 RepID=A0ACC3BSQ0_PYRYE|nr:hypothetical protein I4F81_003491 [Neopyropia yezoensis]
MVSTPRDRAASLETALATALAAADMPALQAVATSLVDDSLALSASVPLLARLVAAVPSLPEPVAIAVAEHVLVAVGARVPSFEAEVTGLREKLAAVYEAQEGWAAAAATLRGIPFDGSHTLSAAYKLRVQVKIARLYLEDDNTVEAEMFLNRAAPLLQDADDQAVALQYRVAFARILDAKRRFAEAAMQYYSLSQLPPGTTAEVTADQTMEALGFAVRCAVLAPAGPQRSRILSLLWKDERSRRLDSWAILEAMHCQRLLPPALVATFAETLAPHQRATLADGETVLARAVVEHNLAAAAALYVNIGFAELGELLGVSAARAEETAAKMIQEGRMKGVMDQVDGVLEFDTGADAKEAVLQWDAQIASVCAELDSCVEAILTRHPEFALVAANGGGTADAVEHAGRSRV